MNLAIVHAKLLARLAEFGCRPDYERILESVYRSLIRPGETVIDIGAHAGRHTRVFAELVGPAGHVHAFEPLPVAMKTLLGAGLPRWVTLHSQAVGLKRGSSSFVFANGAPQESGFLARKYNFPDRVTPEAITVEACWLDDLIDRFERLSFIKIDVEGGEIDCLRSARRVIDRYRPWISVEYGQAAYQAYGYERRTLFDEAVSMKYAIADLFGAVCGSIEVWEQTCDRGAWDWILIPQEKLAGYPLLAKLDM